MFLYLNRGDAGVSQEPGDGIWGGAGDGDADGDLAVLLAVDGLEVEGLEQLFGQAGGGAGEDVAEDGQGVEQGGGVELVALGFEGLLLSVQFAVPGADPLAQGSRGGIARGLWESRAR